MSDPASNAVEAPGSFQLSYVSLAGDDVPAPTRQNVHLLQHAAVYQSSARNLRISGIGDIIWGSFIGFVGLVAMRANPVNAVLLVLAALLAGVGIWIVAKPSPLGMLADGITYLILAAWNVFVIVLNTRAGLTSAPILPGIIIGQLIWGIYRLLNYQKFAAAAAMQPSQAALRWLADLSRTTLKTKSINAPDVIQFSARTLMTYRKCKARLLPEIAVVVASSGGFASWREIQLAAKDDIEIISQRKRLVGGFKVRMRIAQKKMKAQIPADSLTKLQQWMASPIAIAAKDPGVVGFASLDAGNSPPSAPDTRV